MANKYCFLLQRNDPNLLRLELFEQFENDESAAAAALIQMGASLLHNTHLRRLDFAVNYHWTSRGAQALAAGIKSSCIRVLWMTLRTNERDDCDDHAVWYQLLQNLRHSRFIQQLTIVSTPRHHDDDAAEQQNQVLGDLIASLTSLQQLSIFRASSASHVIPSLAKGLCQSSSSLIRLELCNMNLGSDQDGPVLMRLLAMGLSGHGNKNHKMATIRFVRLDYNRIDDEGIAAFFDDWNTSNSPNHHQTYSAIQELRMCHNKISGVGAQIMLRAISNNRRYPKMKYVQLDCNQKIGHAGLERIGNELRLLGKSLTRLSVCACVENHNKNDDSDHNRRASAQKAHQALVQGMHANVYLREFTVANNSLLCSFKEESSTIRGTNQPNNDIEFYCQLNRWGRYLMLSQLEPTSPTSLWCHVLAKCGQHNCHTTSTSAMYYFVREQPHLICHS